jgi:hypothetical protein
LYFFALMRALMKDDRSFKPCRPDFSDFPLRPPRRRIHPHYEPFSSHQNRSTPLLRWPSLAAAAYSAYAQKQELLEVIAAEDDESGDNTL